MRWSDVGGGEPAADQPATTDQRRLIHVGVAELATHPELVGLLSAAEAATMIDVLLAVRRRYRVDNEIVASPVG